MRSARAKRWSLGSSKASAATSSSDFMTKPYCQPAWLTSHLELYGERCHDGMFADYAPARNPRNGRVHTVFMPD
jgi:hypothetical protein